MRKTELFILPECAILSTEDKTLPHGILYWKAHVLQGKREEFFAILQNRETGIQILRKKPGSRWTVGLSVELFYPLGISPVGGGQGTRTLNRQAGA